MQAFNNFKPLTKTNITSYNIKMHCDRFSKNNIFPFPVKKSLIAIILLIFIR